MTKFQLDQILTKKYSFQPGTLYTNKPFHAHCRNKIWWHVADKKRDRDGFVRLRKLNGLWLVGLAYGWSLASIANPGLTIINQISAPKNTCVLEGDKKKTKWVSWVDHQTYWYNHAKWSSGKVTQLYTCIFYNMSTELTLNCPVEAEE